MRSIPPKPPRNTGGPKEIALLDIAAALGIAFAIAAVSQKLSGLVKSSVGNELIASMIGNPYVVITTVTVILATLFARQFERIRGSEELGSYLLYVFLFAIGLPADLVEVIKNVPLMFVLLPDHRPDQPGRDAGRRQAAGG